MLVRWILDVSSGMSQSSSESSIDWITYGVVVTHISYVYNQRLEFRNSMIFNDKRHTNACTRFLFHSHPQFKVYVCKHYTYSSKKHQKTYINFNHGFLTWARTDFLSQHSWRLIHPLGEVVAALQSCCHLQQIKALLGDACHFASVEKWSIAQQILFIKRLMASVYTS